MARADSAAEQAVRVAFAAAGDADARERAGSDLLAIAGVLDREPRLRAALTDPSLPAEAKRGLAEAVFGPHAVPVAIEAVLAVALNERMPARELPEVVDEVAAQALIDVAEEHGSLTDVADQLVGFAHLVERDHALRSALTDPALPDERKRAVLESLLAGRVDPRALTLLGHWVDRDRVRNLTRVVERTIADAAARRDRAVAEVTSAVPLSDEQRSRLADAFERVAGKPVDLQVEVDPLVVGSLSVRIGDEVYDGTVKRQLDVVRERLGAA